MSIGVVALVLLAALLHASWNALLKSSGDRLVSLAIMTIGAGIGAIPLVLFTPLPHAAAWPYIILSAILHTGYNLFLIRAYRIGDFGQSYPIARGSSPMLVSIGAAIFVGEQMSSYTWIGVALVSIGIVSLAHIKDRHDLSGPIAAFTTGAFIAAYTVTDGIGARAAGHALALAAVCRAQTELAWPGWRHDVPAGLRDCDLGCDAGTDGNRLGIARDLG